KPENPEISAVALVPAKTLQDTAKALTSGDQVTSPIRHTSCTACRAGQTVQSPPRKRTIRRAHLRVRLAG
ncbi:hypothetical protein, partial [Streptomyces olivaceus]